MTDIRRATFERVFNDLERQHSAFEAFTEIMPLQDVDDELLRYAWQCFRAGWNALASRPAKRPIGDLSLFLTGERDGRPCAPCRCGSARREIIDPANELHYSRTGCLTCNAWDVAKSTVRRS